MKRIFLFLQTMVFSLSLFLLASPSLAQSKITEADYAMLLQKINDDNVMVFEKATIDNVMSTYDVAKNDGSYTDINYAATDRVNWPPMQHVYKMMFLAQAYVNPSNYYYGNEDIYNKIYKGLDFWNKKNPNCSNWWYNQVGEPQQLGIILIRMRFGKKQLPAELEKRILDRMAAEGGNPSSWTGVNRTDVATHWLYRGVLSKNANVTQKGLDNIFYPIFYTAGEGFQHDNSYFQHGSQLMISGYGEVMINSISRFANYVAGTPFAVSKDKLDIISKFTRQTYYGAIRGNQMGWDILGRGLGRKNCTVKNNYQLAERMVNIDAEHKQEYLDIAARIKGEKPVDYAVKPLHTHYFRGDYTLHIRPEYTFSIRMVSNRTKRNEWGDGGNLQGYFVSDGGTCIMRTGEEYYNIFGAWNWTQLPGTTAPQMRPIPLASSDWQTPGTSTFAGGVSDSLYGASVYSYYDKYQDNSRRHSEAINTGVNKSWFFFDKEVVCLGSVTSTAVDPVQTTVNQCKLLNSDVLLNDGTATRKMGEGEYKDVKAKWVLHNKIGYVFPQGGNIWLNNHVQTGNWGDVCTLDPREEASEKIFSLGFDYAKNPTKVPYAYIVVPTVETEQDMVAYHKANPIDIVSNTNDIQSVYHKTLKIWQTIFFKAGTLEYNGMKITADKNCALMLKPMANGKCQVHISDPAQRMIPITISIQMPGKRARKMVAHFEKLVSPVFAGQTLAYDFPNLTKLINDVHQYIESIGADYQTLPAEVKNNLDTALKDAEDQQKAGTATEATYDTLDVAWENAQQAVNEQRLDKLSQLYEEAKIYSNKIRYDVVNYDIKETGLIKAANYVKQNAQANGPTFNQPTNMLDGRLGTFYLTDYNGGGAHPKNSRHWVEFKFDAGKSYKDLVLLFTQRDASLSKENPVCISILAPGADGQFTDVVYTGNVKPNCPFSFGGKEVDNAMFKGLISLKRPVSTFRLAVDQTILNTILSGNSGPCWSMSELRFFEPKTTAEYLTYPEAVRTGLETALKNAEHEMATGVYTDAVYQALETAYNDFKAAPGKARLEKLTALVGEVTQFTNKLRYDTINYDIKEAGLIKAANYVQQNAQATVSSFNQPTKMLDGKLGTFYLTDYDGNGAHPKNSRHWVEFKFDAGKSYKDLVMLFTQRDASISQDNPVRISILAPGADGQFTDVVYTGDVKPNLPFSFGGPEVANAMFKGLISLKRPVSTFRLAVDQTIRNTIHSGNSGPCWSMSELRFFEPKSLGLYEQYPEGARVNLETVLEQANQEILAENATNETYDALLKAYEDFKNSSDVADQQKLAELVDEVTQYTNKLRYDVVNYDIKETGLIKAANYVQQNAQATVASFNKPTYMLDGRLGTFYLTDYDGNGWHPKNSRHWVEFKFDEGKSYKDLVMLFTQRDASISQDNPVRISILAPGADGQFTDVVYTGNVKPNLPFSFGDKEVDNAMFKGLISLKRPVSTFRLAVDQTIRNTIHSGNSGPCWSMSELRFFEPKKSEEYAAYPEAVRTGLETALEKANQELASDKATKTTYDALLKAYNDFKAANPLKKLEELVKTVTTKVEQLSNPYGHLYGASAEDYAKNKGLVTSAKGNADNSNGLYKPAWLFNNDINSKSYYATEWKANDASRPNPLGRHWVQMDMGKELSDLCLKYTSPLTPVGNQLVFNANSLSGIPSRYALVAPAPGEKTDVRAVWTDTLYKGTSIPSYPTLYRPGYVAENSTFVDRVKLTHPAQLIRFVCLEQGNNKGTTNHTHGPSWNMLEMRIYDGREWDPSPVYQLMPTEVKTVLLDCLAAANAALAAKAENGTYQPLEKAYQDFLAACEAVRTGKDEFWKNINWGTAYGTYKKTAETDEAIAALQQLKGSADEAAWNAALKQLTDVLTVNVPEEGHLLRIKASAKNEAVPLYLSSDNTKPEVQRAVFVGTKEAENEPKTIFCYNEGKLSNYQNGYYLTSTDGALGFKNMKDGVLSNGVEIAFKYVGEQEEGAFNVGYRGYDRSAYFMQLTETSEGVAQSYQTDSQLQSKENIENSKIKFNQKTNFELERVVSLPVVIGNAKYASFYAPVDLAVSNGVKAYTGIVNADYLTLVEVSQNVIPAHTAVILVAESAGTYHFAVQENTASAVANNALQGNLPSINTLPNAYTLQNGAKGIGLYPYNGKHLKGFKAYLVRTANMNALQFRFDGEQTGIENVKNGKQNEVFYDLNGRRVFYPTHGVYVTGEGKKVLFP